uniref:Uncharacterized protein n=1 Tax=viral metagenome TaxID=1070528 RepID=A0A6C0C6U5_9ZZZZ
MPCLIKRDDGTLAYISKINECLIGRTPRSRPNKKVSQKEKMIVNNLILEINRIINKKELNTLQKQFYYRKINILKKRIK